MLTMYLTSASLKYFLSSPLRKRPMSFRIGFPLASFPLELPSSRRSYKARVNHSSSVTIDGPDVGFWRIGSTFRRERVMLNPSDHWWGISTLHQ